MYPARQAYVAPSTGSFLVPPNSTAPGTWALTSASFTTPPFAMEGMTSLSVHCVVSGTQAGVSGTIFIQASNDPVPEQSNISNWASPSVWSSAFQAGPTAAGGNVQNVFFDSVASTARWLRVLVSCSSGQGAFGVFIEGRANRP